MKAKRASTAVRAGAGKMRRDLRVEGGERIWTVILKALSGRGGTDGRRGRNGGDAGGGDDAAGVGVGVPPPPPPSSSSSSPNPRLHMLLKPETSSTVKEVIVEKVVEV